MCSAVWFNDLEFASFSMFSLLISAIVCVGGCRLWRVGWGVGPLCLAHYSVSPAILTSGNWQVGEGEPVGRRQGGEKGRKREKRKKGRKKGKEVWGEGEGGGWIRRGRTNGGIGRGLSGGGGEENQEEGRSPLGLLARVARVHKECEDKRLRNAGSPSRVYSLIRNLGGLSARDWKWFPLLGESHKITDRASSPTSAQPNFSPLDWFIKNKLAKAQNMRKPPGMLCHLWPFLTNIDHFGHFWLLLNICDHFCNL